MQHHRASAVQRVAPTAANYSDQKRGTKAGRRMEPRIHGAGPYRAHTSCRYRKPDSEWFSPYGTNQCFPSSFVVFARETFVSRMTHSTSWVIRKENRLKTDRGTSFIAPCLQPAVRSAAQRPLSELSPDEMALVKGAQQPVAYDLITEFVSCYRGICGTYPNGTRTDDFR